MRRILEDILFDFCTVIKLLAEPVFLIKTYFAPGGSVFLAYDYNIGYKEINGEQVALFTKDPHLFRSGEGIILPIKSQLEDNPFNVVYTEYTDKKFFVDVENNILYLKDSDLAFRDVHESCSFLSEYIHNKRHERYTVDALAHLNAGK